MRKTEETIKKTQLANGKRAYFITQEEYDKIKEQVEAKRAARRLIKEENSRVKMVEDHIGRAAGTTKWVLVFAKCKECGRTALFSAAIKPNTEIAIDNKFCSGICSSRQGNRILKEREQEKKKEKVWRFETRSRGSGNFYSKCTPTVNYVKESQIDEYLSHNFGFVDDMISEYHACDAE